MGEWRKLADMFAGAARGTTSTCEGFIRALKARGGGELAKKLVGVRDKWCRKYVRGMRRDYIASLSEGLNGAIKKRVGWAQVVSHIEGVYSTVRERL